MKTDEIIDSIFYTKKYSLSKALKTLRSFNDLIIDDILKDKPFPDFKTCLESFEGKIDLFSLGDIIMILNAYVDGRVINFDKIGHKEEREEKAERQSKNFDERDNMGLLGVSIPKDKDEDDKKKKSYKTQSVWTVKKK